MTKIEGHEIDIEQSSDGTNDFQWRLVFTKGIFEGPGVLKTTEPVQFLLKKSEYQSPTPKGYYIYYNPYTNKYNIIDRDQQNDCTDWGYNMGGFIVIGCKLTFVYPKCTDDTTYIRPFAEEFTNAYETKKISCEDQEELCGAFLETGFTNDFEIDCPIIEDNNSFDHAEFDNEEFETIP